MLNYVFLAGMDSIIQKQMAVVLNVLLIVSYAIMVHLAIHVRMDLIKIK